ncbi:MAG: hypothetical protein IPG67_04410 [Acidobacteria bacterium]|nr:hypothetical protein [Acidobacteriota bacterium]
MANSTRLFKSIFRLLFPVLLIIVAAVAGFSIWLVYKTARPQTAAYLVTPEKFGQLSSRAAQITDESWTNRDGSGARGWLLRAAENAPAVILFHKYGADRSYVLNLGVKLNESTNFTVLMPDLRAHGNDPKLKTCSFGGCETEDATAAVEFVRGLKTANQITLVGKDIGLYGVELGSLSALTTAAKDKTVKAIALDSVPERSDQLLEDAISRRFPFASNITAKFARLGTYLYFFDGCYKHESFCETARSIEDRKIMLLAGIDAQVFQESTGKLAKCFAGSNKIEQKLDLSPSGYSIINASLEQSESYDQRVIDFFRGALQN